MYQERSFAARHTNGNPEIIPNVVALIPLMVPDELRSMIPVIQWAGGRDNDTNAGCAVIGVFPIAKFAFKSDL